MQNRALLLLSVFTISLVLVLASISTAASEPMLMGLGPNLLPGFGSISFADAVSADGSVVVGTNYDEELNPYAFRWTAAGGMVGLDGAANAVDVSADGSVIVGVKSGGGAFRWTESGGMTTLPSSSRAYWLWGT